jgi:hypothetical protein
LIVIGNTTLTFSLRFSTASVFLSRHLLNLQTVLSSTAILARHAPCVKKNIISNIKSRNSRAGNMLLTSARRSFGNCQGENALSA